MCRDTCTMQLQIYLWHQILLWQDLSLVGRWFQSLGAAGTCGNLKKIQHSCKRCQCASLYLVKQRRITFYCGYAHTIKTSPLFWTLFVLIQAQAATEMAAKEQEGADAGEKYRDLQQELEEVVALLAEEMEKVNRVKQQMAQGMFQWHVFSDMLRGHYSPLVVKMYPVSPVLGTSWCHFMVLCVSTNSMVQIHLPW